MNRASAVQSAASVQTRDAARPTLSSEAPVFKQGDQARPGPREVRGEQERVVLADHAVDGVRGIGPVDEDADHRVVDRPELGDRLVGPGQEPVDHVGRPPQLLQGRDQLPGRLPRLRQGPLVRLRPVIPRPEDGDLLRHRTHPLGRSLARRGRSCHEGPDGASSCRSGLDLRSCKQWERQNKSRPTGLGSERLDLHVPELDPVALGLQADEPLLDAAVVPLVDDLAVDPEGDVLPLAGDLEDVPLAGRVGPACRPAASRG